MEKCVFCSRNNLEIITENELALAFHDICPVSPGHLLIIPKRHVETYFDATFEEHAAMNSLVYTVKEILQEKYTPDGFNIGANIGHYAGQTVFHFHLHIIPRYSGDVPDPRGGIRKVIPKQKCPLHHHKNKTDTV